MLVLAIPTAQPAARRATLDQDAVRGSTRVCPTYCYPGQKQDGDNSDKTVGCFCR